MKLLHNILKIMFLVMLLMPGKVCAQSFDFDIGSVEASIGDHKRVRSILLTRSAVEQANQLLHQNSSKTTVEYKDLNIELDKYTRCFDIIDLIYNSGKTVFNAKNTYDDVKDKLIALGTLNQTYIDKCLAKGNINPADSIIIKTYARMVSSVEGDAEDLIRSLYDLALYVSNISACKTTNLMLILDRINDSMNKIRRAIDRGYYILWKYITIRTTFWKQALYQGQTRKEICDKAIERWTNARYELFNGAVKNLEQRREERENGY